MENKGRNIRQISYKKCVIWIIIGVVLTVISGGALFFCGANVLLYSVITIGLLCLLKGIPDCFIVKKENEYLRYPDYGFDYDKEFTTYTYIGRNVKKPKNGATCHTKFSKWKNDVVERNDLCIGDDDFYRYLNGKKRRVIRYLDCIKAILIPVEIGIIAAFCTNSDLENGVNMIGCTVSSLVLIIIVLRELDTKENEKDFLEDLCIIVNERKKNAKDKS